MRDKFLKNADPEPEVLNRTSACARQLAVAFVAGCLPISVAAQPADAPSKPIKRTPLQTLDVLGTAYKTVVGLVDIRPNVSAGRHTHTGPEAGYVLEGEILLLVEGQPDKLVKAGESYQVPAGAVHDARTGGKAAKLIATYVIEKGRTLATEAP